MRKRIVIIIGSVLCAASYVFLVGIPSDYRVTLVQWEGEEVRDVVWEGRAPRIPLEKELMERKDAAFFLLNYPEEGLFHHEMEMELGPWWVRVPYYEWNPPRDKRPADPPEVFPEVQ